MTLRRRCALVALLLVVGACSGDDGGAPAETTAAPAETTAVPSTTMAPTTTGAAPTTTALATSTTASDTTAAPATTQETTTTTAPPAPLQGLGLEVVVTGLGQPTVATAIPGDPRLFVAERQGRIVIIRGDGTVAPNPFLDLTDRVVSAVGIEVGLLGFTFHPDFAANGRVFVYYTNSDINRTLSEFTVFPDDLDRVDPAGERVLFTLDQPAEDNRHYGGDLHFGPDGHLYVSVGDGTVNTNGQDPDTLFGSILRLNVDGGDPYAIPADNPFVDGGGAAEVWAYGLRNPWRFSIDRAEGLLYVGDVGQESWEEVNVLALGEGGENLGWPAAEGNRCFLDPQCDLDSFVAPLVEYPHSEGCSVTGGHVYRGAAIPELSGHYFYGDWCGQWLRSLRFDGEVSDVRDWTDQLGLIGQVNAFGVDGFGELYTVTFDGTIAKIVPIRG